MTFLLPLRTKFIVLFCLLITVPLLLIGTITYFKYQSDVERNTLQLTHQIVDQIRINLDRYVKEAERLTLTPHYDDTVMGILRRHEGPSRDRIYLTTEETIKMNLFISSLSFDRSEIEGMLIFANDGSVFSNLDLTVKSSWDKNASQWMEPVKREDGGLAILPPHDATYYEVPKKVVSIARVIREPYTNRMLGIVKVDLTGRGFEKIFDDISFSDRSVLQIRDKNGDLLYASSGTDQVREDNYIAATVVSDYTGFEITGLIPRDDLHRDAIELTQFTLAVSLAALLLAYVLAIVFSNRLVRPIAHLLTKMRRVQRGHLDERAEIMTSDEIGQLAEGFNNMIDEIERLVKEVYETKLREREAELYALQSQIHPHFLYNTLEMINMLAVQGRQAELSSVVTNLGKLLRYTVDRQEQQVYLQDEVRFAESYLQIQAFRLGDRLRWEIHLDPSYEYCAVPKLILQPLVENVIEHALGPSTVRLVVTAKASGDDLVITVQDDGAGMSEERIEQLEKRIYAGHAGHEDDSGERHHFGRVKKGFALRNVHQRIRLLHGDPYGLGLDRNVERGARFTITMPLEWRR